MNGGSREAVIFEMMHDAERTARLTAVRFTLEKAVDAAVKEMFGILLDGSQETDRRAAVSQVVFDLLEKSMTEVFDRYC